MTIDVGTTKRGSMTPTRRLKIFEAHSGRCCVCSRKIEIGESWILEHIIPLALGGPDEDQNLAPAHKKCADAKTFGKDGDLARAAKAKRIKQKSLGIRARSGRRLPGGRDSPFRKKLDGSVVRRTENTNEHDE